MPENLETIPCPECGSLMELDPYHGSRESAARESGSVPKLRQIAAWVCENNECDVTIPADVKL